MTKTITRLLALALVLAPRLLAGQAAPSGDIADLIAVPGDPLADPSLMERVSFVMQRGRVVVAPEANAPERGARSP